MTKDVEYCIILITDKQNQSKIKRGAANMNEITNIKQITFPYIKEYVIEQGETAIQWLVDIMEREVKPDKNGRERQI